MGEVESIQEVEEDALPRTISLNPESGQLESVSPRTSNININLSNTSAFQKKQKTIKLNSQDQQLDNSILLRPSPSLNLQSSKTFQKASR
jgi:hypothetical protein